MREQIAKAREERRENERRDMKIFLPYVSRMTCVVLCVWHEGSIQYTLTKQMQLSLSHWQILKCQTDKKRFLWGPAATNRNMARETRQ